MKKPHVTYVYPRLNDTQLPARRFRADVSGCWWNEAGEPTSKGVMESRRLYNGLDKLEADVSWRGWRGWPRG